MGKMLIGAVIILISIAVALVALFLWIIPEPLTQFELGMLAGAMVFVLASGIFVGALFIERGICDRAMVQ